MYGGRGCRDLCGEVGVVVVVRERDDGGCERVVGGSRLD